MGLLKISMGLKFIAHIFQTKYGLYTLREIETK